MKNNILGQSRPPKSLRSKVKYDDINVEEKDYNMCLSVCVVGSQMAQIGPIMRHLVEKKDEDGLAELVLHTRVFINGIKKIFSCECNNERNDDDKV